MTKETLTPSLHQSHDAGIATEHSGLAQTVELDEGLRSRIEAIAYRVRMTADNPMQDAELREWAASVADDLESLLPKPDPAKALAESWLEISKWEDMGVSMMAEDFARWLITTGKLGE